MKACPAMPNDLEPPEFLTSWHKPQQTAQIGLC